MTCETHLRTEDKSAPSLPALTAHLGLRLSWPTGRPKTDRACRYHRGSGDRNASEEDACHDGKKCHDMDNHLYPRCAEPILLRVAQSERSTTAVPKESAA